MIDSKLLKISVYLSIKPKIILQKIYKYLINLMIFKKHQIYLFN